MCDRRVVCEQHWFEKSLGRPAGISSERHNIIAQIHQNNCNSTTHIHIYPSGMSDLDSFAFEPGQQVQCRTRFDQDFKGEVMAFDLNSKILILKSPASSGNPANHDLNFLVLDSVSNVEILEEPERECNNDLPNLDTRSIKARQTQALDERMRLVEAVGNGVSQEGISLYTALAKKYDRPTDVIWKDKNKIVVMNSVIISPPYKEADCTALTNKTHNHAVNYVKQNVHKFWESLPKPKQEVKE